MKEALLPRGLLFCCAALLLCAAISSSALVMVQAAGMRFAFISEPQVIRTGAISGELKIQTQDEVGAEKKTDETIDLAFSSSSSTGEFLNAAGNAASTVMARGTANRTFYYRDLSSGAHILTVRAVGRTSRQSGEASQRISVESGTGAAVPDADLSQNGTPPSAALSPVGSIAFEAPPPAIEVLAGRDQTAVAGGTVSFQGTAIGLLGIPIESARFWWNFGDGGTAEGRDAVHVFRVPGGYLTGLHVSSGIYAASDYVAVTVIPNKITVIEVVGGGAGFVRMRNGSDVTLDIGGWTIEDERGKSFILPPLTMIRGKSDIALPHAVTGFVGTPSLTVRFPDRSLAFAYSPKPVASHQDTVLAPTVAVIAAPAIVSEVLQAPIMQSASMEKDRDLSASGYATSIPLATAARRQERPSSAYFFLGLAVLLSGGACVGFLFLKRFFI